MAGMNWALGKANDAAGASAANPAGYLPMLKILTGLGFVGFALAFLLRQRETGPKGHGLETITMTRGPETFVPLRQTLVLQWHTLA